MESSISLNRSLLLDVALLSFLNLSYTYIFQKSNSTLKVNFVSIGWSSTLDNICLLKQGFYSVEVVF